MKCPNCNGVGKVDVHIVENGKESRMTLDCHTCDGQKQVSEAVVQKIQEQWAMWCDCTPPSEELDFYDDGVRTDCRKHHWRCQKCQKIVQVG